MKTVQSARAAEPERPGGYADPRTDRRTAMVFYATGRTAEAMRAAAAEPLIAEYIGLKNNRDSAEIRDIMLGIADGIDKIAAEGLTREQCFDDLGLVALLGPFESQGGGA